MMVYRICHRDHSPRDPGGALLRAGRWHVKGTPVLYASASLSLAVLELRVNGIPFDRLRSEYHYSGADLAGLEPDAPAEAFYASGWRANQEQSRAYGLQWLRAGRAPVLRVRSAVLPAEANYLIHAAHPAFAKVRFTDPRPIPLDARL